jgi:hypothetical protein
VKYKLLPYKTTGETIFLLFLILIFMFSKDRQEDREFWNSGDRHYPNVILS